MPQEEWLASLPRKQMGVGVLFLNETGELLIVKPNYRDHWQVVGGVIDANESPMTAAIRETKEEITVDIDTPKLLGVAYVSRRDSLRWVFYGGVLGADMISNIKIQKEELDEFKFVPMHEALTPVSTDFSKLLPVCFEAIEAGIPRYLEI